MAYKIHRHQASDAGLAVNAYIVENDQGLVLIDALLLNSDSKALMRKATSLNKPILGILITHSHPDHIAGLTNLANEQTPIFATQAVIDLMRSSEAAKHAQWSGMFGDEWIKKWTYPNEVVSDGANVQLGGMNFTVHDVGGGGDCEANAMWVLENNKTHVFAGDIIYNENFSYMNDGQILRWLANLDRYTSMLKEAEKIYIGHGPSGSFKMVQAQKNYLNDYCSTLLKLTKGNVALDEEMTQQFVQQMEAKYPTFGLNFMLGLSAAKVASELS